MMMNDTPRLFKITGPNGESIHGGRGRWTKGRWRSVRGPLVACSRGLHLVTAEQLPTWLAVGIVWEAETDGELIEAGDKWVARRARVVRQAAVLDERTLRLLACDFAEHVLPIYERLHPNDARPREAIAVARRFTNGEATREELTAARAAARDAAGDAAWDAARDAAWDAARDAARAAARDAAGDAARDAAWAAAWDAERAAERAWQAQRTAEVLGLA